MSDTEQVSTGDRLSFTLFLAVAMHAMLIFGVSFKLNSGDKIAPTLNVTLATHKSHAEPDKADFLAQFNQEASGTEQQTRELTTQKQAEIADTSIRDVNPIPRQQATSASQEKKQLLTTTATADLTVAKPRESIDTQAQLERDGSQENAPKANPEIASLQAKLDRIKEDLAKRPRIRRLTSVATKASADAAYLNSWAQQIERVGNDNFPEDALRQGVFGNLRMSVNLYPNGTVARVKILQSSGHRMLDNAAMQIVRMAAPFPPFPPEIREHTDQLEIIRTWRFEIRGLSTSATPGA